MQPGRLLPPKLTVRCAFGVCILAISLLASRAVAQDDTSGLRIALISNREHYWYPHVYLYEHDGKSTGKIIGAVDKQDKRLDHQPLLSDDGNLCIFGFEQEAQVGRIQFWNLKKNSPQDFGDLFQTPNAVFSPSLSSDGRVLAISVWNKPGLSARWDVQLYDLEQRQPIELVGVNTAKHDERRAAISGDGQLLVFTSNAPDGQGLTDLRSYDRKAGQLSTLPEMNSTGTDSFPSLNGDGRLICFASDRPGGFGGLDIYLYDRLEKQFIPLPGLNSAGQEQSPSITRDGRFIAFVSERFGSAGEHDVFIYDRVVGKLLPTPDLNTDRDDYDPYIVAAVAPNK